MARKMTAASLRAKFAASFQVKLEKEKLAQKQRIQEEAVAKI